MDKEHTERNGSGSGCGNDVKRVLGVTGVGARKRQRLSGVAVCERKL